MRFKTLLVIVFLFLMFFNCADAHTQDILQAKVTLSVNNVELQQVLKSLQSQTGANFAYSPEEIQSQNKVSYHFKSSLFSDVLEKIAKGNSLSYEITGNVIVLHKIKQKSSVNNEPVAIQKNVADLPISGKVTDRQGSALIGVTVKSKNTTSAGTVTDVNGNFTINVKDNAVLIFSYVGYVSQEIQLNGRTQLNVILLDDLQALKEVVVVGYGIQKRENVIGSIGQVTSEQLVDRPVTQLKNALTGLVAGLTITQDNGRPGAVNGTIRVRGVGSFGASPDALILVDGIPTNSFNAIDPNDVESISVLKDASSAAIYGARAANGVILVTTKLGKSGKATISYNGYAGFQHATTLPSYLDSYQFALAFNEAQTNDGITPTYNADALQKYKDGSDPDHYPNSHFFNDVVTRHGIQTGHAVNLTGGSNGNLYNLSLGYLNQGGLVVRDDYSKYNVRLNLQNTLSKKLVITTRLNVIPTLINEPTTNVTGLLDGAVAAPPNIVGIYSNGNFGEGVANTGTAISTLARQSFYKSRGLNMNGNLKLDYNPISDLKLSFVSAYVQTNTENTTFQATQQVGFTNNITVGPSTINIANNNSYYYNFQGLANYVKQIQKHQLNVLFGFSFENNNAESTTAFRSNLPSNDLPQINLGDPSTQASTGTGSGSAIESEFARLDYSYAGKYLAEGVVRRDGSSRFPTNDKYAYFPSVAVGWRIGQERFIKNNLPWINELKLKASRGVLGNQNIGDYPYQNTLGVTGAGPSDNVGTNYAFGGVIKQGVARTQIVDTTLHWESTRTTDLGLEVGLFKNKLNFSATYFDRYTYDILVSPASSVSNVLGFTISQQNSGKLENKGWEFTLSHNSHIGKFSYSINTNFSIINNKVLDLGVGNVVQPNGQVGNGTDLFIGYPTQLYYGYVAQGLFANQADIDAWPKYSTNITAKSKPGDIKYADISGPNGVPDGVVDPTYDRTYLGSQIPKYTYGGTFSGSYGSFDFSVVLQGVGGAKGSLTGNFARAFVNGSGIQTWMYNERWSPENPDPNAGYPRLEVISNAGTANTVTSSFFILNAAYLRVKNAQLGYTLPKQLLQKIKIASARIYLSGENLHTFSHYRQGWDPEINGNSAYYPILANYTLGFNVTF